MAFASRKFQRIGIVIVLVFTGLYFLSHQSSSGFHDRVSQFTGSTPDFLQDEATSSTPQSSPSTAYDWVFQLINKSKPSVGQLTEYKDGEKAKEKFATDDDFVFSRKYLSNLLNIDDLSYRRLKEAHASYMADLEIDTHKSFHADDSKPSGEGIVFVGGIKFSWLALIGIEQLRLLGCNLPIEVFIGDEGEYEHEFCEVILPKYNGRCTYLPGEVGDLAEKLDAKISGYQYKNLAFLISKFEKILFLDADNVPLKDPTPLFKSDVFKKHGLVIWPDAWARTTTPKYYEIAGITVTDNIVRGPHKGKTAKDVNHLEDVTFHDFEGTLPNPSSESGMILVDKTKHCKTLLLSLYYNIFGPKLYYSIFSQGSAGEGDKETFIAAATVLGANYYQVLQPFKFIGYHYDGQFNSKALGQADPIQDYKNFLKGSHLDETNRIVNADSAKEPDIQFMHLSYPKLIPFALLNDNEIIKPGNEHVRMYLSTTEHAGYDFELRIFQIVTGALCKDYTGPTPISEKLIGLKLKEYWGQDPNTFCPQLIEHTNWLKNNPE
ncbi:CYFA0S10e04258g1_1 [Cyberlindnera fabianii]|uniref:CYFA0S10e04258g1_1 n=1 Tax=Cyberlindnera fabianii TaxID=36022 RepID=A0A061B0E9_CYBFA|nr:CYFA0S10e04258g1_1 [Cyberlindnera fabianii]